MSSDSTNPATTNPTKPSKQRRSAAKQAAGPTPGQTAASADLRQLLSLLKEFGVAEYRTKDLSIRIEASGWPQPEPNIAATPQASGPLEPIAHELSPEDMLFWSAPENTYPRPAPGGPPDEEIP